MPDQPIYGTCAADHKGSWRTLMADAMEEMVAMNSNADIDALDKLHAASTQGPMEAACGDWGKGRTNQWECVKNLFPKPPYEGELCDEWSIYPPPGQAGPCYLCAGEKNAKLLVGLLNAYPAISAELRQLRKDLAEARAEAEKLKQWRIETKDKTDCWECGGTACSENGFQDCVDCKGTGLVSIYDRDARLKREGAAEILRNLAGELPGDRDEIEQQLDEAISLSAEALELLAWMEFMGAKVEFRGGLSRSFDKWLVNAGSSKSDAITGKTLLETLRAAKAADTGGERGKG